MAYVIHTFDVAGQVSSRAFYDRIYKTLSCFACLVVTYCSLKHTPLINKQISAILCVFIQFYLRDFVQYSDAFT